MHLHAGAVQRHGLDLDLHHLRLLQLLEGAIENARLRPAAHARVDRVPVAKTLGQATPFAAVFGGIQDGVEHLQIRETDVAALARQAVLDLLELGYCNLHALTVAEDVPQHN